MEIAAAVLGILFSLGLGGMLVTLLVRHGASPEGVVERWRRTPLKSRVLLVVSTAVYVAVGVLLARASGS